MLAQLVFCTIVAYVVAGVIYLMGLVVALTRWMGYGPRVAAMVLQPIFLWYLLYAMGVLYTGGPDLGARYLSLIAMAYVLTAVFFALWVVPLLRGEPFGRQDAALIAMSSGISAVGLSVGVTTTIQGV